MPYFGTNLNEHFTQAKRKFSITRSLKIVLSVLEIFEEIHQVGYIYNDLKLENLLLTPNNEIRLIDFGLASKYVDSNGGHLLKRNKDIFDGNMMFATLSQFKFESTSRRDDLISLCYLLVYLINDSKVPFSIENFEAQKSVSALFKQVKKVK